MKIEFTKMHGLGNDFIVLDLTGRSLSKLQEAIIKLADRRFGIGFDQALILKKSRKADFRMDIYNGDGGRVEMCGNGIRCFARYIWDRKLSKKTVLDIETLAGIIRPAKVPGGLVKVDMGQPILNGPDIPVKATGEVLDRPLAAGGMEFKITCVSMGNPHCVIFVDDVDNFPVAEYGPLIEAHRFFPNRTNVEFIEVVNNRRIKMRVWERGAGETLACGTGASASVVAAHLKKLINRKAVVELLGGELSIEVSKEDGRVYMTGPAEEVFTGTALV